MLRLPSKIRPEVEKELTTLSTPLGLEVPLRTTSGQVAVNLVTFCHNHQCVSVTRTAANFFNSIKIRKILSRPSLYSSLLLAAPCHLSKVVYYGLLIAAENDHQIVLFRACSDPESCASLRFCSHATFLRELFLPLLGGRE